MFGTEQRASNPTDNKPDEQEALVAAAIAEQMRVALNPVTRAKAQPFLNDMSHMDATDWFEEII